MNKVFFIGAGPGDPELITVKGMKVLTKSDVVIYSGSLVNKQILEYAPAHCKIYDSSKMNLTQIVETIEKFYLEGKLISRLHTGDPSIYGAIYEQMLELDKRGIPYEIIPGVTALFAAAAKLKIELTAPEISQTVTISRVEGKTPVPQKESLDLLTKHGGTFAFYLSASNAEKIKETFLKNGWEENTPVAICHKVYWDDEKILNTTLGNLVNTLKENSIKKHTLIIIGKILDRNSIVKYSKLYDEDFEHGYRKKGCSNSNN
ncbi:precorrin-4 C(11)-methyltransferase [Deferribacter thermophilus]|uniref:precorrin-4 C(11)-methyltransferase n=1 Tax=Deferribacter thermophilus TaxID=53573 RepID=UPI003C1DD6EC